jgi:hypothetical protein
MQQRRVVVKDGKVIDMVETTSTSADKAGHIPESVTRTAKTLAWHEFSAFFCSPGG